MNGYGVSGMPVLLPKLLFASYSYHYIEFTIGYIIIYKDCFRNICLKNSSML